MLPWMDPAAPSNYITILCTDDRDTPRTNNSSPWCSHIGQRVLSPVLFIATIKHNKTCLISASLSQWQWDIYEQRNSSHERISWQPAYIYGSPNPPGNPIGSHKSIAALLWNEHLIRRINRVRSPSHLLGAVQYRTWRKWRLGGTVHGKRESERLSILNDAANAFRVSRPSVCKLSREDQKWSQLHRSHKSHPFRSLDK